MPTVLRIGRYRFAFYSNEGNEPPHIHAKADRDEAKFWLDPIELAANCSVPQKLDSRLKQHILFSKGVHHESPSSIQPGV